MQLWNTLTGGAAAISQAPQLNIFLPLEYSEPQYDGGFYVFDDVQITVKKPATYQLIVVVEGIESRRSKSITVVNEAASQLEVVSFRNT